VSCTRAVNRLTSLISPSPPKVRRHPALDLSSVYADDRSRVRFFYIVLCFHNDMILLSITIIDDDTVVCRYYVPTYSTFMRCTYTPPASKHLFIFPPRVQTRINILSSRRINSYNDNSNNNSRRDGAPFLACVKVRAVTFLPPRRAHVYVYVYEGTLIARGPRRRIQTDETPRQADVVHACYHRNDCILRGPFIFEYASEKGKFCVAERKTIFRTFINR